MLFNKICGRMIECFRLASAFKYMGRVGGPVCYDELRHNIKGLEYKRFDEVARNVPVCIKRYERKGVPYYQLNDKGLEWSNLPTPMLLLKILMVEKLF